MHAQPATGTNSTHLVNGHLSPPPTNLPPKSVLESDSESALSDAVDEPALLAPPSNTGDHSNGGDGQNLDSDSNISQDEDASGSDDPDYGVQTSAHHNADFLRDGRSTSRESPHQRKRKIVTENDDYMMNDPELY